MLSIKLPKRQKPQGFSSKTSTPPCHTETYTCGGAPSTFPMFDDGVGITRLVLDKQRGLDSGIDYLRVKGYFSTFDNLTRAVTVLGDSEDIRFSDKSWSPGPGATLYDQKLEHPLMSGGCRWDSDIQRFELCLDLSGLFWSQFNSEQQLSKLRLCRFFKMDYCSRIDLKIDDYTFEIIPYKKMVEQGIKGNMFGTNSYKPFRKYQSGSLVQYGDYYGSRNSSYFLRCYVHTFGDNEYHSMRLELEVKRKKAQLVYDILSLADPSDVLSWDDIIQCEFTQFLISNRKPYFGEDSISNEFLHQWGRLISEIILGAFDFRDKTIADSRRDSPRFDWWQKFIDCLGGILRIKITSDPPSLPKTLRWIHRQWVTTLAQLKYGLGINGFKNFMQTLAEYGLQKMQDSHYANINYLMLNPDAILDFSDSDYAF